MNVSPSPLAPGEALNGEQLIARNPATGEEIMIPAKPATKVPRFTFSKVFKEAALKAKVKK